MNVNDGVNNMTEFLYQHNNLLDVRVIAEDGYGIETGLIIDSLKAALATVTCEADEWIENNPSPAING